MGQLAELVKVADDGKLFGPRWKPVWVYIFSFPLEEENGDEGDEQQQGKFISHVY